MSEKNNTRAELLDHPLCIAMLQVFDHLPDTYFFIKDKDSRFIYGNRQLLDRLALKHMNELAGTTDYDRYPEPVADQLVRGDLEIMQSGEPLIDHPEVLYNRVGKLEWYLSSKFPILTAKGQELGVVGFTKVFSERKSPRLNDQAAGKAVDYISNHLTKRLRVSDLAKRFNISERQLNRQFLATVKLSPREFILRSRINAAASDLRMSNEPIISLAEKYRFCDQSAFTRQFRRILGATPARYRESLTQNS